MAYTDGTEDDGQPRPKFCPLCSKKLALRWRGQIQGRSPRGYVAQAWPFFVCKPCDIAVRIGALPDEPLRTTRKAARADVQPEIDRRNADFERRFGGRR